MILDEILDHKRIEVAAAKERVAPEGLAVRARHHERASHGFRGALSASPAPRIIAEVKRRSPSKGEIRADFDPVDCARAYARSGAAAISVLTDEKFFGGHLEHLAAIRDAVHVPLLRKDFVIDPYQIDEARVAGADAVLLIVSALDDATLKDLRAHARSLGLDTLVEIHDEAELDRAVAAGADLIGINNRDLRSFETDLAVTERLASRLPEDTLVVAESGIHTPEDLARLTRGGADAFLVGESLMREADVGAALARLRRTT